MITGYVGRPGKGKTLLMTWDARRAMRRGRKVYANYPVLGAFFWTSLEQTYGVRNGVIAMDEAGSIVNSRKWEKLPDDVVRQWQQSRKLGLDLLYTAQAFTGVDKILRGITNLVWVCQGGMFGIHFADCYPAELAEKVQTSAEPPPKHWRISRRYFIPFLMRSSAEYDTLALVGDPPTGRYDPAMLEPVTRLQLGLPEKKMGFVTRMTLSVKKTLLRNVRFNQRPSGVGESGELGPEGGPTPKVEAQADRRTVGLRIRAQLSKLKKGMGTFKT